jgi:hypothetical protein
LDSTNQENTDVSSIGATPPYEMPIPKKDRRYKLSNEKGGIFFQTKGKNFRLGY